MALNVTDAITAGLALTAELIKVSAAAKAAAGANASLTTEVVDAVEAAVADPVVQSALKALISAL